MQRLRLPTLFTPQRAAAEAALRSFLLNIALWLIDQLPHEAHLARAIRAFVRNELRVATQQVRLMILARAIDRMVLFKSARTARPRAAPPGWRLQSVRAPAHRRFARAALPRSTRLNLRAQILRLRAVIDNAAAWAGRLAARLERGIIRTRIVTAQPPAIRLPPHAPAPPRPAADTS
ncbi:MAG: hypothetical protein HXY28_14265 [Hydrogenophilaceae bacterium]|jgi:hypothetical protein|nr:hypothetical protein [Hydrogenophilaceae bacterium]